MFKNVTNKLLLLTTCGLMFTVGCKKEEPQQEVLEPQGRVVMWINTLEDCIYNGINFGSHSASVDIIDANGQWLSVKTVRNINYIPDCTTATINDSLIVFTLPVGTYSYTTRPFGGLYCDSPPEIHGTFTVTENGCSLINVGLSTNGGNSYSLTGTWLRTHAYGAQEGTSPCDGVKIQFDGTQGKIISAPSSCCFTINQIKWTNYNVASGTIDDMVLNLDCTFKKYDSTPISFTDNNHIVIGGEFNTVHYVRQ